MTESEVLGTAIGDGKGGVFEPNGMSVKALVLLLHGKVDNVLVDHECRIREVESGLGTAAQKSQFEHMESDAAEAKGARRVIYSAMGLLFMIIVLMFSWVQTGVPTNTEIREQINSESPWARDKSLIERRLSAVEDWRLRLCTGDAAISRVCSP